MTTEIVHVLWCSDHVFTAGVNARDAGLGCLHCNENPVQTGPIICSPASSVD
jgi:hypothetical protein